MAKSNAQGAPAPRDGAATAPSAASSPAPASVSAPSVDPSASASSEPTPEPAPGAALDRGPAPTSAAPSRTARSGWALLVAPAGVSAVSVAGVAYDVDDDRLVEVPAASVAALLEHQFTTPPIAE